MTAISDRYRRLSQRFTDLIAEVPADQWAAPSPCDGWSARDVLDHVVTTEASFLGGMPFAPDPADDLTDLHVGWAAVRARIQAALDTPAQADHAYDGYFGPTTFAATADRFYSFDLVAHCWDIAKATGMHAYEVIDSAEIEKCRADFAELEESMRQPGLLGPVLDVPADATAQSAFIAWLGRKG
jgi:uncharacterized protein (TIGR03086 family)